MFIRAIATLCCGVLLVSACAPAISSSIESVRKNLSRLHRQGGGAYTDTPGAVDYGSYPLVDPVTRGFFYYPDDLAAFDISDKVEAGSMIMPSDQGYVTGGTDDTGDDMVLDGRPAALPRDQSPAQLNMSPAIKLTDLWATTDPSAVAVKDEALTTTEQVVGPASIAALLVSIAKTGKKPSRQGGYGDGNGGVGIVSAGNSVPRAGEAFSWEGWGPGGGSSAAPGYVNTQTGNRMTVMPIVGWKVPGGMGLGLTLYHNSEDNLDVGWGMNWRSSFDMRLVFAGSGFTNGVSKATVTYPSGKRLVFTNPHRSTGNVWYPPTGFYDVLASGFINHGPYFLRTKGQIVYNFDNNGFLVAISDRYNNKITINRSGGEGIISVVDAAGNTLTFAGNRTQTSGHYTTVTTPTNTVYTFTVGAQGYNSGLTVLRSVTFPTLANVNGGTTASESFSYDLDAAIIGETARDGTSHLCTYDGTGRLLSFSYPVPFYTNPIAQTGNQGNLTYHYSYGSTATVLTDPYGKTVTDNYSGGTLRSEVDQQGYSQTYTWDVNYNCSQYTSARQYSSYFGYDNYGNMTRSQDPLQYAANKSQLWTYNSWNDVLTAKDTRGATTTYGRDPTSGVVLTVKDGLNNLLATNTYNGAGQLLTTNSANATTTVSYDGSGRPSSVQTPDQAFTISYASPIHNLPGLPYTITDGQSRVTTLWYDEWARTTNITRSDGAAASVTLDLLNRATDVYDWLSHHTHFDFDAAGRPIDYTYGGGAAQTYRWADMDRLAGVIDGNNHTRTYNYTVRGEMSGFTLADNAMEVYQFDGDGNQTTRKDGLLNLTNYYYNSADYQYQTKYPDNTTVQYAYDYDGRTTSMVDATGTTGWVYDLADRLTNFNSAQGNLSYGYDQWGRRTLLTEPNGVSISYAYTAQRLTSINKQPENETTSWTYDGYGRLVSQNNSNGTVASYGYDNLDRLASILHQTSSNSPILSETYGYDLDGELTSKISNGTTTQYQYDGIGQLTGEYTSSPYTQYGPGNVSYSYDGNGNRLSKTVYGIVTENYNYDSGDKLSSVTRNTGTGNQAYKSYTYDVAGHTKSVANALTNQTLNLNYDYEDRISSISGLSTTNQYTYNALDTRVKKVDSAGTATYIRDGEDATDPVLSDGSATYVPGISRHTAAGTRTYHQNFVGSNSAESDGSQATQATRTHDAFGGQTASSGSPTGPFGFAGDAGYQEDGDSGLKLLGHRYYDSSSGRFITRDPAQDGRNWYAYAENSPTNSLDPSGFSATMHVLPMTQTGLISSGEGGNGDPWDGSYGDAERRIWGGIGAAFAGIPAGLWHSATHPLTNDIETVVGVMRLANDIGDAAGGDNDAFGRVDGQLLAADAMAIAGEVVGPMLPRVAGASVEGDAPGCAGNGSYCFVAGTRVLMADGSTKPIEQVRTGDAVASRSESAGPSEPIEPKSVTGTSVHFDAQIETITLRDGTSLQATPAHPFYVAGHGFEAAKYLTVGSKISEGNGTLATVGWTTFPKGGRTVYNFTVDDDHTYFIGASKHQLWVHNGCGPSGDGITGPGPFKGRSIKATGRRVTPEQSAAIQEIGNETGCHRCGSKEGPFYGDHQPANSLNPPGGDQYLYPHCRRCSNVQGGTLRWLK